MAAFSSDTLFLQEQRRFRRLEVSLPVWVTTEAALREAEAHNQPIPWSLGYTRDLSMGGSKIVVPERETEFWQKAKAENARCLARFEAAQNEPIPGALRRASVDESGQFSIGLEFFNEAHDARSAALRAGLSTLRRRQTWQGAFALALVLIALAGVMVFRLQGDIARQNAQIARLEKARQITEAELEQLSKPALVSTRAQGIAASFQRKAVQRKLREITGNIARLNDPNNMENVLAERAEAAQKLGVNLAPVPRAARVTMGVAFPYGYAWPPVVRDLEEILGRKVPQIVVFKDWREPFPDLDVREARARGKTLQITWEPWYFSDKNAVKLDDIVAGKWDKYIDDYAAGARSFGGELWIRWGHEMNGNWYPWCASNNGSNYQTYIRAYRHIHDRFQKAGASNVRWIWCINAESVPNVAWNEPLKSYPGDNYVDAVAIDGYNFGSSLPNGRWLQFSEIFDEPYARVTAKFPRKPLFIGETGCATAGGDKTVWLQNMDVALKTKFPEIEAVTWFEAEKEADWRLVSSPEVIAAAKKVWNQPYYRRGEG